MNMNMQCATAECERFGILLEVDDEQTNLETGEAFSISTVYCGSCNKPLGSMP